MESNRRYADAWYIVDIKRWDTKTLHKLNSMAYINLIIIIYHFNNNNDNYNDNKLINNYTSNKINLSNIIV